MADNRGKINLILASHVHVSSGAPEQEFDRVCENTVKPFISNLYKYPRIQAVLHYSGVLLHWIERSHPELFMLIEDMISRKQTEMLGGGFYEPMLPLLPLQDKIGQIELLTTYLRRKFGKRPTGCWLPALAWEQNLVGPLAACGMGYTFLGEEHFKSACIDTLDLYSPCLSEDQGKIISIFPIFNSLEKELEERDAETVFRELADLLPKESQKIISVFPRAVYSSPGESLDYAWYRFFEAISHLESIVECVNPAKVLKGLTGIQKACPFNSQANSPRRFLIEYPEANGIYSKMIFTSLLINQLRGDKARKQNAREELWKAQDSDLFSSAENLYNHLLRKQAYRSLLTAERITREKTKFVSSLIQFDFNFDGLTEYLFQDQKLNCYVQTLGAGIFELDYMPKAWNYLDTCRDYDVNGVISVSACKKPENKGKRTAFSDVFVPAYSDPEDLFNGTYVTGRNCADKLYTIKGPDRSNGKVIFCLPQEEGIPFGEIGITKTFSLKKDTVTVLYSLCNMAGYSNYFIFNPQIDLSFPGDAEDFVRIYSNKPGTKDAPVSQTLILGADGLWIKDIKNDVTVTLTSECSFDVYIKPRYIKNNGTEMYQSTAILPVFKLLLAPGETWNNELSLKFTH